MRTLLAKSYSPLQVMILMVCVGVTAQFQNPFLLLIGLLIYVIPTYTGMTREELVAAAMLCDPDLHEVNSCPDKVLERVSEKNANYERNTRRK